MMRLLAVVMIGSLVNSPLYAEQNEPLEIIMNSKLESMEKAGVGAVAYPHKLHSMWYECGECHPKVFAEKNGSSDINMNKIISEQFCGSSGCHNSAYAFPLYLCENCHEIPEDSEKK